MVVVTQLARMRRPALPNVWDLPGRSGTDAPFEVTHWDSETLCTTFFLSKTRASLSPARFTSRTATRSPSDPAHRYALSQVQTAPSLRPLHCLDPSHPAGLPARLSCLCWTSPQALKHPPRRLPAASPSLLPPPPPSQLRTHSSSESNPLRLVCSSQRNGTGLCLLMLSSNAAPTPSLCPAAARASPRHGLHDSEHRQHYDDVGRANASRRAGGAYWDRLCSAHLTVSALRIPGQRRRVAAAPGSVLSISHVFSI